MEALPADQLRVLGVLVEKQRTVPDSYPLTLNSLTTGCNQSSNRDPVTSYDQAEVQAALDALREAKLTRIVYSPSNRAPKFRHVLDEVWDLDDGELAVLTILLLRGPNTVPELRTRTERYEPKVSSVEDALRGLADKGFVTNIGRASGQREDRWMHLVGGEVDASSYAASPSAGPKAAPSGLAEKVAALEARVAALEEALGLEPGRDDGGPQAPVDADPYSSS